MNFAQAITNETRWTRTENGAIALNTTSDACLDLFGTIGALREASEERITTLFEEAYKENPLLAAKIAFYARDIRGDKNTSGLGERRVFRVFLKYMALQHPEVIKPNLDLIGVYGRFDDLYELIDTPLENEMWNAMRKQFKEDYINLNKGNAISLLAKWIKTPDASSANTRRLGILTAQKLGYNVYSFKRILRAMRRHIGVVEALMSTGQWDKIKYSEVPSRAMTIYRNAFIKHDEERFTTFAQKAVTGEVKINSSTLYPYDLIEKMTERGLGFWWKNKSETEENILQAQWDALPNFVTEGTNAVVMVDTSGSMSGRPICTALGLGIYFAQRNSGAYHGKWMTFSSRPSFQTIKGKTMKQIYSNLNMNDWDMDTDLPNEMPKSLIVVSDMEINYCANDDWTFYDQMRMEFLANGYEIPQVVFWNVNSRHDVFHADSTRKGVVLCSGQSPSIFQQLIGSIEFTPVEFMLKVINSERYEPIKIG